MVVGYGEKALHRRLLRILSHGRHSNAHRARNYRFRYLLAAHAFRSVSVIHLVGAIGGVSFGFNRVGVHRARFSHRFEASKF